MKNFLKFTPDFNRLRIFGCKCFVLLHKRDKLSPKAIECVFLGYGENQKGYRCFDYKNNKLYVSKDVTFLEDENGFEILDKQNEIEYMFLNDLLEDIK